MNRLKTISLSNLKFIISIYIEVEVEDIKAGIEPVGVSLAEQSALWLKYNFQFPPTWSNSFLG